MVASLAVIVCGCREWTAEEPARVAMANLPAGSMVLHGACRGADSIAAKWAGYYGHAVTPFPYRADLGKAGGPARNAEMLRMLRNYRDLWWDVKVIAFHVDPDFERQWGGGTRDMVRRARAAGVPVEVVIA